MNSSTGSKSRCPHRRDVRSRAFRQRSGRTRSAELLDCSASLAQRGGSTQSIGSEAPASSAKSQIGHLAVHGRRAEPPRSFRSETGARQARRQADARIFRQPLTSMGTVGNTIMPTRRKWAQHGQSGLWVSDWYPHIAQACRRSRGYPILLGRRSESRRLGVSDEYRRDHCRAAISRRVADLRTWHSE